MAVPPFRTLFPLISTWQFPHLLLVFAQCPLLPSVYKSSTYSSTWLASQFLFSFPPPQSYTIYLFIMHLMQLECKLLQDEGFRLFGSLMYG